MCDHVCSRPIRLGDSSREHPTELARGRLENPPSKPEIQRATAILQVAQMKGYFAAVHQSASGPSRRSEVRNQLVAICGLADATQLE